MFEFRILGPLEVVGEHGPIRLGGPRQRGTLAILLLGANRVVPVERLADDLYRGAAPVTAVTQVQRQVSELRKLLDDPSTIETRTPGYLLRIDPEQLDLHRFERRTEQAEDASAHGDDRRAVELLREALDLWRGDPLADLADEPFARTAVARLAEIRLAAVVRRIAAEFALGRHADLIGELQELAEAHRLDERFQAQLMLALYRSGRQREALAVYRAARETLVSEFGLEPTAALRHLERAILAQDPSLELVSREAIPAAESRPVLVLPSKDDAVDPLLSVAERLAHLPARELVVARLLVDDRELRAAAAALNGRRTSLAVEARVAAFTTGTWSDDVVRLAATNDVALVLLDAPKAVEAGHVPEHLATVFEGSAADVGVLAGPAVDWERGEGVFVPFGGGVHDWAALELAAWLASASAVPLRLVGTRADPNRGRRDASRLLADAALAVQRLVDVPSEPLLAEPTDDALLAAVARATIVVQGISPRWRQDGIGGARRALVRNISAPVLLVHGGPRPGGLAPRASGTRFTWSIQAT